MSVRLNSIIASAQAARDAGQWRQAIGLYGTAVGLDPVSASLRHNLALCHFAAGGLDDALKYARDAVRIQPDLWQSMMIESKVHRTRGAVTDAESALIRLLRVDPENAAALVALADLEINEFGDPASAVARVRPLLSRPETTVDAQLTTLMADLYLGSDSAEALSRRLITFSRQHLRMPIQRSAVRSSPQRPRVALISPLFSLSPVYFMTFNAFEALAARCDLICFNRGTRQDVGTRAFADIAAEWHDVPHHDPASLANAIRDAEVDVLFDLGGWTDAVALTALSSRPAARMYTWVGGQSATTGLEMFDGWIGDAWQSPAAVAHLYAEPIVNIAGGYCDYRMPAELKAINVPRRREAVGLVGNPCKVGDRLVASWPTDIASVTLIDRRYVHQRTRDRVVALLERAGVRIDEIIVPQGHAEYLRALAGMKAVINTAPYSGGLTTIEAMALGVEIITPSGAGKLFCERHHLSHRVTAGRNPALAGAIMDLVMN
jgi:predicted O-linked N-acetylglucosamine transferase (SPINDLY family)